MDSSSEHDQRLGDPGRNQAWYMHTLGRQVDGDDIVPSGDGSGTRHGATYEEIREWVRKRAIQQQPKESDMANFKKVDKFVWKTEKGKRLFEVEDGRFYVYSDFMDADEMTELRDAIAAALASGAAAKQQLEGTTA